MLLLTWRMSGLADVLALVVSELVTNSVNASTDASGAPKYVQGRLPLIRLRLLTDGTRLVAEVWDQAPRVPVLGTAGRDDETGRGLDLVDMLTESRWGWYPARSGPGKCVWAELSVPAATARGGQPRSWAACDQPR
jgi:hypothetical protein